METNRHRLQMTLLADLFDRHLAARRPDHFVGANMFLAFGTRQAQKNDFRNPDIFVVLGVEQRERTAWVVWDEGGKVPDLIVDLTAGDTNAEADERRMRTCATLRVPYRLAYVPGAGSFECYRFENQRGEYRLIAAPQHQRVYCEMLDVEFGVWDGKYRGFWGTWLRCFTREGELVPLAEEAAREHGQS